jgi:hypothetical protein
MIRLSRLVLIAVTVAGSPLPALAQSSQHRVAMHKTHHHAVAARQSDLNAFAMVPGVEGGAFSPAANGGGSVGYNEYLRRDQW